jgi:hypothetical protein
MRITARAIAHALGGRRAQRLSDGSYLIPCPVPSHGRGRGDRTPSLRIGDGASRVLVHCYSGCDRLAVLDELRRHGLLDRPEKMSVRQKSFPRRDGQRPDSYARQQHHKAAWLWSQRQPIVGTIAEAYLRARGITCPLPPTLGFLPTRQPEHHPAMIAAFALPDEPEPGVVGEPHGVEAVHLTLLKPDGSGKADVPKQKIMVGSAAYPIVLAPMNDLLGLAITEGIEDAVTVHQATGLGAWAAGAAGRMPRLSIPSYVETVTIYAHDDKAGQDGARKLAEALRDLETRIEGLR